MFERGEVVRTFSWVPDPNRAVAKSTMDSREVAQNLDSPLMGSRSHCVSVYSMALAWGESWRNEKNSRRYGRFEVEKGMESASCLESNLGETEGSLLEKYMGIVFPSLRSTGLKKTFREGSI